MKEGLDPPVNEEEQSGKIVDKLRGFVHLSYVVIICFCWPDGDRTVATKLASPVAAEAMLNGTECDSTMHKNLLTGNNKAVLLLNENGTSDTEPPHGSVTGSNGLILTKQLQQQEAAGSGVSPHRTNWSPSGSPTGDQTANPLPASASAVRVPSPGALRTSPSTGTSSGPGTSDTKNGPASSPVSTSAPVTVHRARKTMSRPAVSPAQKVQILFYFT